MLTSPKNPVSYWLFLYISINFIALIIMFSSGLLLGDVSGRVVESYSDLFIAFVLVVSSYFLVLGVFFNVAKRVRALQPLPVDSAKVAAMRMGYILLFLQIGFFVFNSAYGVNVAGGSEKMAPGLLSYLWIVLPVDSLFLVYYFCFRDSRLFKYNFMVWFVSNLMRGWAGVILIVIFCEYCRLYRAGKIQNRYMLIPVLMVVLLYPFINDFKWAARSGDFTLLGENLLALFNYDYYFERVSDGVTHLVGRIQVTSMLNEAMRLSDVLQQGFSRGDFIPYWKEGIFGVAFERIFYDQKGVTLGVMFTEYAGLNTIDSFGNWNTNIGFFSWFLVAPLLSPLYVLYVSFFCIASVFLVKSITRSAGALDGIWFIWLIYIMPPWIGAFVSFVYALFLFLVIHRLCAVPPVVRFRLS